MSDPHGPEMIRRREILRRAAWLLGGAISAPAALAVLQGCTPDKPEVQAWISRVLSASEMEVVSVVVDILLPKTDTSGALDAGVPRFIDAALDGVYSREHQQRFKAGLAEFAPLTGVSGKLFIEQDRAEQEARVKQALESALASRQDYKPFMLMTRELALLGYFSSKVGITENMEYVAVPTAYHGCVPLSQLPKHVYWE